MTTDEQISTPAMTTDDSRKNFTLVDELKMLRELQEKWNNGVYKQSTEQLYQILTICYKTYEDMFGDHDKIWSFQRECANHKLNFVKQSDLPYKIIKYVFRGNTSPNRLTAYKKVIEAAIRAKIPPNDLAEWIYRNGGVEQIKMGKPDDYVSPKNKALAAKEEARDKLVELRPFAVLSPKDLGEHTIFKPESDNPYVFVLAKSKDDGSLELLKTMIDDKIIDQVMLAVSAALTGPTNEFENLFTDDTPAPAEQKKKKSKGR